MVSINLIPVLKVINFPINVAAVLTNYTVDLSSNQRTSESQGNT